LIGSWVFESKSFSSRNVSPIVSLVRIGGLILINSAACLFPKVAGGRFSWVRPSPCATGRNEKGANNTKTKTGTTNLREFNRLEAL
jgi:hypothetical protein